MPALLVYNFSTNRNCKLNSTKLPEFTIELVENRLYAGPPFEVGFDSVLPPSFRPFDWLTGVRVT